MGKIFLVVPDAPIEEVAQLKSNRTLGSAGIRLDILDNSKANADHLLKMIVEGVRAQVAVAEVSYARKPYVSMAAPPEILDQLAREADVVISAMAD